MDPQHQTDLSLVTFVQAKSVKDLRDIEKFQHFYERCVRITLPRPRKRMESLARSSTSNWSERTGERKPRTESVRHFPDPTPVYYEQLRPSRGVIFDEEKATEVQK